MDCTRITDELCAWLVDKVKAAQCDGIVFGLSGGIDSAVVAGLGMRAMPDRCLGVILPCYSDPQELSDADEVARTFDLPVITYDIGPLYDVHLSNLSQLLGEFAYRSARHGESNAAGNADAVRAIETTGTPGPQRGAQAIRSIMTGGSADSVGSAKSSESTRLAVPSADRIRLTEANLKPRLRMTALYYYANILNFLVAGTTNRSELTVGYFTKYGDGGSDLLPLGGMVKTQVRELAAYLGVPQQVIDKAPTAGLWAGQTDESEMGISYEDLDRYILTGIAPDSVKNRVDQLNRSTQHKLCRAPIPDIEIK